MTVHAAEAIICKKDIEIQKRGRGSFFSGVMILSLSAIIVKIIGLVYKTPMLKLLGSEGMGYFNSAYEIYAMLCVISTTGLPVAMSVMISSCGTDIEITAKKIFNVAMRLFLILGTFGALIMALFAFPISSLLKSDKSFYSILAIAPALFFVCLSSAYRGYFQGKGKMLPTAVSQIIEALGKLILGIIFAKIALFAGYGTDIVAAYAVLGLTAGSAATAIYLVISKRISDGRFSGVTERGDKGISKRLMCIAIPVTVSSAVMSVTRFIDMTTIIRRLQNIGYTDSEAFSMYGGYTTLVIPLFSLAPALVGSIALPLIPELGGAIVSRDINAQMKSVSDAIRMTMLVAMPVSVGLSLYSYQILNLIFVGEHEAINMAVPLLCLIAPSIPMSCLVTVGHAILQSYGRSAAPIVSMTLGSAVKMILAFVLIGNSSIGILGAPISTFFCDLTILAIDFYLIKRCIPGILNIDKLIFRPFVASMISIVLSRLLFGVLRMKTGESGMLTLASIGIAAFLYFPVCFVMKIIDANDIKMFSRRE